MSNLINNTIKILIIPFLFIGIALFLTAISALIPKTVAIEIYTDSKTECQYIYNPRGGDLTIRLDGDGNHIGCK